jgi:hypothetical protein
MYIYFAAIIAGLELELFNNGRQGHQFIAVVFPTSLCNFLDIKKPQYVFYFKPEIWIAFNTVLINLGIRTSSNGHRLIYTKVWKMDGPENL